MSEPTIVAYSASTWTGTKANGSTEATGSFTWQTGDVFHVFGVTSDNQFTLSTPSTSGSNLTFSEITNLGTTNATKAYYWRGTATGSGSGTITSTNGGISAVRACGIAAFQYRNTGGQGTPVTATASANKTLSVTRARANSHVIFVAADWNAVGDTSTDPTPAGGTERVEALVSSQSDSFLYSWDDQGAVGTTSYGVTNHTGTVNMTMLAVEIYSDAPVWEFLGVSNVVQVTAASHALVTTGIGETLQQGDLLIACISSRIASTTSITLPTGGEWALVSEQKTNNVLTTTSAVASGMMAYCVRGASDPNFTFTHPTAPSVALGRIIAYRNVNQSSPKDTQTSFTTAVNTTAVSGTGLTTAEVNELIVAMAAGGQEAAWSAFDAATSPSVASGATNTTSQPTSDTWLERADSSTTAGADTSLAIFDAIKPAAGATGNLTATASLGASHVVIAGAFKFAGRKVSADPGSFSVTGTDATFRHNHVVEAAAVSFAVTGTDASLTYANPSVVNWDSTQKNSNVALTNSDLTATSDGSPASTHFAGRAVAGAVIGSGVKRYWEITVTNSGTFASNDAGTGVCNSSQTFADNTFLGSSTNSISYYCGGDVYYNSSAITSIGNWQATVTICVACDGGNAIWWRVGSGNWNGSGTADPATNTGGVSISSMGDVFPAYNVRNSGSLTANFGATAFAHTPPSGFSGFATSGNYTLTADPGNFVFTGTAASTLHGREVAADTVAYTVTGTDAALKYGHRVAADTVSYTVVGTAANLIATRVVSAEAGSYVISGTDASLYFGKILAAFSGTYTIPGTDASFLRTYQQAADSGSYSVSGTDANFRITHLLDAQPGSYAFTGSITTFGTSTRLEPEAGSFEISGTDASFLHTYLVVADSGSFSWSGTDATFEANWLLTAESGSYTITGTPAVFGYNRLITAAVGNFVVSGTDAGFLVGYRLVASEDSLVVNGTDADLSRTREIEAAVGVYVISGTDAGGRVDYRLDAAAGSFDVEGTDVALSTTDNQVMVAESGDFEVAGGPAELKYTRIFSAESGSFVITGTDAVMGTIFALVAESGSFSISGDEATFDREAFLVGGSAAFVISGTDAALKRGLKLAANTDSFVVVGSAADVTVQRILVVEPGSFEIVGTEAILFPANENAVTPLTRTVEVKAGSRVVASTEASSRTVSVSSAARFVTVPTIDAEEDVAAQERAAVAKSAPRAA